MAEAPADLKAAIHEQSDARVAMDIQGYAKYLTPDAIESLRASFQGMPPRVSHYNIESVSESGSDWQADVRYFSREDSFVVRSKWGRKDEAWVVLLAERMWEEGQKRPGFLSKTLAAVLGPLARMRRAK
jgi:hypothetical protein